MVDFKVVDDEDDDTVPLQKSTEDKVLATPTTNRVEVFMELVKVILLIVICIILGVLLRTIRVHTTTLVQNAQVVPLGDPVIQLQTAQEVMYKVVSWKSDYYQGCTDFIGRVDDMKCYCGEPPVQDVPVWDRPRDWENPPLGSCKTTNLTCSHCGGLDKNVNGVRDGYPRSKSSFMDVALREGLTNEDIFNTCSFPTRTRVLNTYSARTIVPSPSIVTSENATFALPISKVESKFSDCVMEKLVNRIAEGGWEFIPSPSMDSLYFRRQKV